jgi:hypothetical protein
MVMTDGTRDILEAVAQVLLRCWIIGMVVQLILIGVVAGLPELIHFWHHSLFNLSAQQSNAITADYASMLKLSVGMLFFVPWLALRLVLRRQTV